MSHRIMVVPFAKPINPQDARRARMDSESLRDSRRLHHLREWSHGKYVEEIFS
jgi:hypothetical protein